MMDDLISRKVLKQAIYTDYYEHFTQCHDSDQTDLIDMVMNDIDEIPAVFDKEKVIEELRAERNPIYREDGSLMSDRTYISINNAIEIVEKGGIE